MMNFAFKMLKMMNYQPSSRTVRSATSRIIKGRFSARLVILNCICIEDYRCLIFFFLLKNDGLISDYYNDSCNIICYNNGFQINIHYNNGFAMNNDGLYLK